MIFYNIKLGKLLTTFYYNHIQITMSFYEWIYIRN